jgi:hypothetical protein
MTLTMNRSLMGLSVLALLLPLGGASAPPKPASTVGKAVSAPDAPAYATDGNLKLPENYREWIFLTSALDMNYNDPNPVAGHSLFQNVFVNPSSYRAFLSSGTWPDKTTFILELRGAEAHVNIDKRGQSQTTDLRAIEIHVKDESRIPGKWGFYNFNSDKTAKLIERPATCYTCHEAHAAVDTTFVQFYPTLLGVAKAKATLSPEYLKDTSFPGPPPEGK